MFRFGGGLAAFFVVAVQSACGLERVELGGFETGVPGSGAQSASGEELDASTQPGEGNPSANFGGAGAFDPLVGAPGAPMQGCTKVDFLFVIDNSRSMAFAQENLSSSIGSFLDVLGTLLGTENFHVMVVDTDGADDDDGGDNGNDQDDAEAEASVAAAVDAGASGSRCDAVIGAGRRTDGAGTDCQLPAGQRYLTDVRPERDAATFQCLATVGTQGDADEQQAGSLLGAVSDALNEPAGCNEGFLRDDAILVVTLITNTDDTGSPGDPDDWYNELLSRKNDVESSVVMLGFLPGAPSLASLADIVCNVVAIARAPRLQTLVSRFTHSRVASVCESDYGPDFAAAVESIDQSCEEFVPPVIQ